MTCPICKAPSVGTKPCPGYCEGVEDGRAGDVYAVLHEDEGDASFSDINDGSAGYPRDAHRSIGTREQAVAHQAEWGGKVVRVVPDGAHEAERYRAILERDIAEVERALAEWMGVAVRLQTEAQELSTIARYEAIYGRKKPWGEGRELDEMIRRRTATAAATYAYARDIAAKAFGCEAWLARAKAALQ